jgi:hypothetical protein
MLEALLLGTDEQQSRQHVLLSILRSPLLLVVLSTLERRV